MSNGIPDDDENLVGLSCYEHLKLAVEALLLTPDLSNGLEGAFLQLMMLREEDFPLEARELFSAIMAKYEDVTEKAERKRIQEKRDTMNQLQSLERLSSRLAGSEYRPVLLNDTAPEARSIDQYRYKLIHPRTKFWFKEKIWGLFTSVRCDDR